jgi:long-chain fatty acid transport protein
MRASAYDRSPVDTSKRSVALPLDRNLRYALGVQYDWSANVTLGLAYEYLDAGNARVRQSKPSPGRSRATTRPIASSS